MKMRIDLRPFVNDPLHWARLVVYVVLVTWGASVVRDHLFTTPPYGKWLTLRNHVLLLAAPPPVLAAGIGVEEVMAEFTGHSTRGVWRESVSAVMISLVGAYLVGPALLVWGLRARTRFRTAELKLPRAWMIVGAITLGGTSVAFLMPALFDAYMSQKLHERMVEDNVSADMNMRLSSELTLMAYKAQVAYFVAGEPWDLPASWQLSDGSRRPALSIVQLLEPGVDALVPDSRHAVIDGRVYEVTVVRADSLTITGLLPPADLSARPADDRRWCSGFTVGVTPQQVTMNILP